jgi:hypothetical protein
MNAAGWYVWHVSEFNAAGDLTRVTSVKTDTLDPKGARRAYEADVARHVRNGYPKPARYSISAERSR